MGGKILIICDEEKRYSEYNAMLADEFELIEVAHEREAIELLTKKEDMVDAILLDLCMSNKKSEALIQLITLDIYTKYVFTLVVGSRKDSDAEEKALRSGATDFVYRPVHKEALRIRLRNMVQLHTDLTNNKEIELRNAVTKKYEQQIIDEIDEAMEKNQFEIYMQPKYDLITGHIAGAETLVRWKHPQKGFIPPANFIPVLEKHGLVTKLDMYVWEETCKVIRKWVLQGKRYVPVSVNVSRKDIYHKNLPKILTQLVEKYGLEPKHLHLEITETAYMENPKQLIAVVKELKEAGFIIEMDDFGSGYSSLSMLSALPIDILKLDMKLVQNATAEYQGRSIVNFVIGLAKWMNLYVVAEGVETKEQVIALKNMDCNYVQGYYYAKPMQIKEITNIVMGETLSPMPGLDEESDNTIINVKSKGHAKNMLVVDDLAMNRMILTEYFKDYFNVIEVPNGKVALDYLSHGGLADVIMLDLYMPIMDGFEVLKEIKKNPDKKDIPIIVTSQADEKGKVQALGLGADYYLEKPYSVDMAFRCINEVMDEPLVIGKGFLTLKEEKETEK